MITLQKYKSRKEFQLLQAKKFNLDITFVDAIDASKINENELQEYANNWTRPIRINDIGCYLSHKNALEKVSKEKNKCLILEDDVILASNIKSILKKILEIDDTSDCIYDLEYWPGKYILGKEELYDDDLINIHKIYKNRAGAAGYIISPQVAKKMLIELKNYMLLDAALFSRKWINYKQIEPCPIVQIMNINKSLKKNEVIYKNNINTTYMNESWFLSRLIRLKIILYNIPILIMGYIYGEEREIDFNKEDFLVNFDDLIKKMD